MAKQYRTAVIIEGDAKGGIRAIQATDEQLTKLNRRFDDGGRRSKKFAKDVDATSRELDFLKNTATGVGAALAGAFAVSNLAGQARMIQRTDALAKSIGVSTQRLQEWQYASQEVGMDADKIGDIMKDVADKIGDAYRNGGGEAIDALNTLNLKAADLVQLSPDETILKIADGLQQLDRYSQVNVLESLGDDATLLQPLLENNAAVLKQYASEARSLGVAMDQVDIDNAVEAARAMNQLQGVATGLSNTLIADLGPGLANATSNLTTLIEQAGGADEVLDVLMTTVGTLATVYLARRLGPGLLTVGKNGLAACTQIAEGMAIALGATGRLNQALVVTQGRIAATAAAGRALNGALALVGGPAGAAILAAGAIYTFRDELGLTIPKVEASSEAVATLTGKLDDMNQSSAELQLTQLVGKLADLKAQAEETGQAYLDVGKTDPGEGGGGFLGVDVGQQVKEIREIGEASQGTRQDMANVEAAIAAVRGRLEELKNKGEETTPTIKQLGNASDEAAKAAEKQANALEQLRRELDPSYAAQQELAESTATLDTGLQHGALTLGEYLNLWDKAAATYIEGGDAAKDQAKRLEELTSSYDANAQKAAQIEQAVADINAAYQRGDIDGDTYARMMGNVRDEMRKLAVESDPMAQEMARSWTEAADRIDETFADAFAGAFDSFEDFGDQLLDGFKRLLAELAYQATLKPIVVQLTGQMGSALGLTGPAQMAGAQSGGMGGMGNLTSLGSKAYDLVTNGVGNIAWTGASNTAYAGGWAGSATGSVSQSGFMGGSTANFTGMNGIASLGAGMAGSYVGTELGSSLTGKQANSNIGATLGGAVGTFFGGPIGAFAGSAIGGMLDSAFGSSPPELDLALQRGTAAAYNDRGNWDEGVRAVGAFGTVGLNEDGTHDMNSLWDPEEAQQLFDGIAQLDNTLATLAETPDQLKAMQDAVLAPDRHGIQGHYGETSTPGDVVGILTSRYKDALDPLNLAFEDTILAFQGGAEDLVGVATNLKGVEDAVGDNAQAMAEAKRQLANSDDVVATAQALASQAQAMATLEDAAERLDLRFDATSARALSAAGSLADLVGGIDTLASLQSQYAQTFTTAGEQFAQLQANLEDRFDDLGLTLPDTVDGFRDLVEAQNLMTEAGRGQYAALLQLVPTMSQYLDAMDRQHSQLTSWIYDLLLSDQSTLDPSARLQEAQSQYAAILVRAENGNADAIGNLGSAASQYLDEAASYYGQGSSQYGSLFDEILQSANALDGSHAAGLASVPFDGYRAELHAGETVLPAPIAQLYRDSAPGNTGNAELLRELQALRHESQQLRDEVRQLRAERATDADRAAGQRADQLREQQRINRNTKARTSTV